MENPSRQERQRLQGETSSASNIAGLPASYVPEPTGAAQPQHSQAAGAAPQISGSLPKAAAPRPPDQQAPADLPLPPGPPSQDQTEASSAGTAAVEP